MKIAVIGPGSMGLLYGAKLSKCAEVVLIGNNESHIDAINEHGVFIRRNDAEEHMEVKAALNGQITSTVDLVIMFTKAYMTKDALSQNRSLIGPDTMLLTLQNGAGHESTLGKFVSEERVLIGTTAQGSYRENPYTIVNSGLGDTAIGAAAPDSVSRSRLDEIKAVFEASGFPCIVSDNIRQMVWNKLMINASSSVLSGILQERQGFIVENRNAFNICKKLIAEICTTANAGGLDFDTDEQIARIEKHLKNAPGGYTSIYSDLKNGRKTEVDYINGAVVDAAVKLGIEIPTHDTIVNMVHAMEGKAGHE